MSRKHLVEQIEAIEFSDEAGVLFQQLSAFPPSSEAGAVILVVAAMLLASQHPGESPLIGAALREMSTEFEDLIFEVHQRLGNGRMRSVLRFVGGIDV
ncbi:hypothetical protein [Acidimangrovimonas sediminis]|uniref:hypothetical protein n=1 Tax=Acidimangrovimonas sediminis TaxID=2056283 RepID=UPI000C7FDA11|nr:hypothetical protein [Acidimangrovimonas sediminis]